jgi:hypothetical protein
MKEESNFYEVISITKFYIINPQTFFNKKEKPSNTQRGE